MARDKRGVERFGSPYEFCGKNELSDLIGLRLIFFGSSFYSFVEVL